MALSKFEVSKIEDLLARLRNREPYDKRFHGFLTMKQRIEQLGVAIPPDLRRFLVVTNWSRVVVKTISQRQQIQSLILPGEDMSSGLLHDIFLANNMSAQMKMFRRDVYTYGRGFFSVAGNPRDVRAPIIRAESPRQLEAEVDPRTESIQFAARFISDPQKPAGPEFVTFYTPEYTVWARRDHRFVGGWAEVARRVHNLGRVPLILHLNERWSGEFEGESELTDIIPLQESAARSLTNLQFAQEAHGIPSIWATGVKNSDFVDPATGEPKPQFESYYDVIKMLTDKDAKWGQFTAADLKNFETSLDLYGKQASIVTGFPARLFGITTDTPASEGAVVADEIQLVRTVEDKNESEAVSVGWTAALAYKIATGVWVEGNAITAEYMNPATPTIAQREDALAKRRAAGALSREGYWDELGWSVGRKRREREYLLQEQRELEQTVWAAEPIPTEA